MNLPDPETIGWCPTCRLRAQRRLTYDKPGWPVAEADPICERCGETAELITPVALYERDLREQAKAIAAARSADQGSTLQEAQRARPRRPIDLSKQLLSKAEAARCLGVDRKKTLRYLIADGLLKTVPAPRGPRIPRAEVERLLREGIPEPGTKARRTRQSKRSRPSPAGDVGAAIRGIRVE